MNRVSNEKIDSDENYAKYTTASTFRRNKTEEDLSSTARIGEKLFDSSSIKISPKLTSSFQGVSIVIISKLENLIN